MASGDEGQTQHARWAELLDEHRVFTLATTGRNGPWVAPLYFAPDSAGRRLLFLSSPRSRHGLEAAGEPRCAGALHSDPGPVLQIRGAQFLGTVRSLEAADEGAARQVYLARFPEAADVPRSAAEPILFGFWVHEVKITDNRVGFGWKCLLRWEDSPA